jgi:hypothetical protein
MVTPAGRGISTLLCRTKMTGSGANRSHHQTSPLLCPTRHTRGRGICKMENDENQSFYEVGYANLWIFEVFLGRSRISQGLSLFSEGRCLTVCIGNFYLELSTAPS